MYANFIRLVGDDGTPLAALRGAGRITNLHGLQRWGYITVRDGVVRLTPRGAHAKVVWGPLADEIEARWAARFGGGEVDALRAALGAVALRLSGALPAFLPVLPFDLRTQLPPGVGDDGPDDLISRMARVLLAFTLDFERDSPLALPVCANMLRVLSAAETRVRDLPSETGVSKEAVRWALGILARGGLATAEPDAGGRGQVVRLTEGGLQAKRGYDERLAEVEAEWRDRFGGRVIDALKAPLARINPRLTEGTSPHPGGWRAKVKRPLPHHPMVLHRGGYPDGA